MANDLILEITNVGPISKAKIDIGKINVVGGKNSTGKSTSSKLLYSFLRANSPFADELILKNCIRLINNILRRVDYEIVSEEDSNELKRMSSLMFEFRRRSEDYYSPDFNIYDITSYTQILNEILNKYEKNEVAKFYSYENSLRELNYLTTEILNNPHKFYSSKLKEILFSEINDQIPYNMSSPIFPKAILRSNEYDFKDEFDFFQYIQYTADRKERRSNSRLFRSKPNRNSNYFDEELKEYSEDRYVYHRNSYPIEHVFYLDSFSIFDEGRNGLFYTEHVENLKNKLNSRYQYKAGINEELDIKIDNLLNSITDLIGGKIVQNKSELEFISNDSISSPMKSTASGIKQIGLIQKLLANRSLIPGSFLIIDEPEVNLHPEWQVKFAEILVLIALELDISLYINTHSPMFIEAISLYSDFYDLLDETNFYLTEEKYFVQEKESGPPKRKKHQLIKETDTSWIFKEGYEFKKIDPRDMGAVYENLSEPYDILDDIKSKLIFKDSNKSNDIKG